MQRAVASGWNYVLLPRFLRRVPPQIESIISCNLAKIDTAKRPSQTIRSVPRADGTNAGITRSVDAAD